MGVPKSGKIEYESGFRSFNKNEGSQQGYGRIYEQENESSDIASRMATAKFEYGEEEVRKNVLEPSYNSGKSISYEELRAYIWS